MISTFIIVLSLTGLLNIPTAIEIFFVPINLKNILAPHLLQKHLFALLEDLNHFNVLFLNELIDKNNENKKLKSLFNSSYQANL